jgi:GTP pyrophosphokinase
VNHKLEPLSYQLKSGDQIEILTSKTQHVQPEWLNFATSAKARGKIQAILRRERREKEAKGEQLLKEFLEQYDVAYNTNVVEKLCRQYAMKTRDELFYAIAEKQVVLTEVDIDRLTGKNESNGWRKFLTFLNKPKESEAITSTEDIATLETREFVKSLNKKKVLALDEENLMHCTFSTCCNVVPGDDVLGYITEHGTLEIHRRQCETATKYKTRHGNNIIACSWNTGRQRYFDTRIFVRGIDAKGVLHSIADCFESLQQFLVKEITLKTNDGIFEGTLLLGVYHVDDIHMVCEALRKIENVTKAVRMD